jgi:ribosome biogenesis GTPase A
VQLRKVCLTDSPGVVVTKEEWQKVLKDLGLKDMLEVRPLPLPRPGVLGYCTGKSFRRNCGVQKLIVSSFDAEKDTSELDRE